MRKLLLTLFLISSQFFSSSYAQRSDGAITLVGVGSMSCGRFVEHYYNKNDIQMSINATWIWGYMVAYQNRGNFSSVRNIPKEGNISTVPDEQTINLYVRTFCEKKPTSNVMDAADSLILQYGGVISYKHRLLP